MPCANICAISIRLKLKSSLVESVANLIDSSDGNRKTKYLCLLTNRSVLISTNAFIYSRTSLLRRDITMSATFAELLSLWRNFEAAQQRALELGKKVVNAPEKGTRDAFYAGRASDYQNEASAIHAQILKLSGYAQVKTVCEAEYGSVSADKLQQMRSRLATARCLECTQIDRQSLEAFASAYLEHAASPDLTRLEKPRSSQPLFQIQNWSELGIGINAHRVLWAFNPAPERGSRVILSNAIKLPLSGKQWKVLVELLAKSTNGSQVDRAEVVKRFGYSPPAASIPSDSRARPNAISDSVQRDELTSQVGAASKKLNLALADLGRKLRQHVDGPTGKHCRALFVEGDVGPFWIRRTTSLLRCRRSLHLRPEIIAPYGQPYSAIASSP